MRPRAFSSYLFTSLPFCLLTFLLPTTSYAAYEIVTYGNGEFIGEVLNSITIIKAQCSSFSFSKYDKKDMVIIPVYHEVDAGNAERNHTSVEPVDWVPVPVSKLTNRSFGIKVVGDSMEPTISHGSVVVVDPNQKSIIDGKVFVIEIPYVGATIKRVFIKYPNLILKADNPSYEEQAIPLERLETNGLRIIGRVIAVFSYDI